MEWIIWPYNSWVKHLFFTLIFAVLLNQQLEYEKMIVAVTLDFVKMSQLKLFGINTPPKLLARQIWCKTVERFKRYCTFASPELVAAAILDLVTISRHRSSSLVKYGENRSKGSKVMAILHDSRWWSPPSWISSKWPFWNLSALIRHGSSLLVKYGENRSNGSKVIAILHD